MPRNMDSSIIDYLASGDTYYVAFLVLIEFPSPYRLSFTTLLDDYQHEGDNFTALGSIGTVSMPKGDGELSPKEYNVTLSGISDEVLEAATNVDYMNSRATCWMIILDNNYNQVGSPFISWRGLTDSVAIEYGSESRVSISVRDRLDWDRQDTKRYTDAEQRKLFPGDRGFEFVSQVAEKDANWPEAAWSKARS